MGFEAGSITGGMSWDMSQYTQGMLQATTVAQLFPEVVSSFIANPMLGLVSIAKTMAAGVAAGIGSIVNAVKGAAAELDDLGEASMTAGVSAQFLAGVGSMAQDAGSSVGGVAAAMKFLNNNMADARGGSQTAIDAFDSIGVAFTDASGKLRKGEDVFMDVADKIAAMEDPQSRTQAAMNLMGRSGTEMIAMMSGGTGKIREWQALMRDLNAEPNQGLVDAGDKFETLNSIVSAAMTGLRNSLAEPVLEWFAQNFDSLVGQIKGLSSELQPMFQQIGQMVADMMPSLLSMGTWIAQTLIPLLRDVLEFVTPIVQGIGAMLGAGSSFVGAKSSTSGGSSSTANYDNRTNVTVNMTGRFDENNPGKMAQELAAKIVYERKMLAVKEGL